MIREARSSLRRAQATAGRLLGGAENEGRRRRGRGGDPRGPPQPTPPHRPTAAGRPRSVGYCAATLVPGHVTETRAPAPVPAPVDDMSTSWMAPLGGLPGLGAAVLARFLAVLALICYCRAGAVPSAASPAEVLVLSPAARRATPAEVGTSIAALEVLGARPTRTPVRPCWTSYVATSPSGPPGDTAALGAAGRPAPPRALLHARLVPQPAGRSKAGGALVGSAPGHESGEPGPRPARRGAALGRVHRHAVLRRHPADLGSLRRPWSCSPTLSSPARCWWRGRLHRARHSRCPFQPRHLFRPRPRSGASPLRRGLLTGAAEFGAARFLATRLFLQDRDLAVFLARDGCRAGLRTAVTFTGVCGPTTRRSSTPSSPSRRTDSMTREPRTHRRRPGRGRLIAGRRGGRSVNPAPTGASPGRGWDASTPGSRAPASAPGGGGDRGVPGGRVPRLVVRAVYAEHGPPCAPTRPGCSAIRPPRRTCPGGAGPALANPQVLHNGKGSVRGWLSPWCATWSPTGSGPRRPTPGGRGDRRRRSVQRDRADSVSASFIMLAALEQLSPEHRTALEHLYFRDQTLAQAAAELGSPQHRQVPGLPCAARPACRDEAACRGGPDVTGPGEHDHTDLLAYGLGKLDRDEEQAVRDHLKACPAAREEFAAAPRTAARIDAVPPELFLDGPPDADTPGEFGLQRAPSAIVRRSQRSPPPPCPALAAAAVLLVIVGPPGPGRAGHAPTSSSPPAVSADQPPGLCAGRPPNDTSAPRPRTPSPAESASSIRPGCPPARLARWSSSPGTHHDDAAGRRSPAAAKAPDERVRQRPDATSRHRHPGSGRHSIGLDARLSVVVGLAGAHR